MRTIRFFTNVSIIFVLFAMLSLQVDSPTKAETNTITIGPWTFDNQGFADDATDLSGLSGTEVYQFKGLDNDEELFCFDEANYPACLDLVLTGFSPEKYLGNIGLSHSSEANWFQLDFTDIKAENNFGADIVFFDCHQGNNSYEFAVRPEGGIFTDFVSYDASLFQATDLTCDAPFKNWGVAIDLSSFGLATGTVVDALQFKALPEVEGTDPESDPTMAAVLYSLPISIFLPAISR